MIRLFHHCLIVSIFSIQMILPIRAYGDPVLKKQAEDIEEGHPDLEVLIENMFDTMYSASGVGLAAPQVGQSIRLFIVDASPFAEPDDDGNVDPEANGLEDFKRVFINPEILDEEGEEWAFEEGCLSIPTIREEVIRKPDLRIRYLNEKMEEEEAEFNGVAARIIQHEYDHLDGVLFTDHLNPLRRRLLKRKLSDIAKGIVDVNYKMKFPLRK